MNISVRNSLIEKIIIFNNNNSVTSTFSNNNFSKKNKRFNKNWKSDRYDLIQYLFHNELNINRFNILPKLILLQEQEKKYNCVNIETLNIEYEIRDGINKSYVTWEILGMHNMSKYEISELYFYTGIDYGVSEQTRVYEINGNERPEYNMREIKESNGIKLLACGLNNNMQINGSKSYLKLVTEYKNAFNLSEQEILNCYPLNFGEKVQNIYYKIKIYNNYNYVVELRRIYRHGKKVSEKIIKTTEGTRKEEFIEFDFEVPIVDMKDVYYFTINKK